VTATTIAIRSEADILVARQTARAIAAELGFTRGEVAMIATAISELTRNVVTYAGEGELRVRLTEANGRRGIEVVASDQGPGIEDVALAMQDGYSSGRSLGLGLPGARRLMDELAIESAPGRGTTVTATKWAAP
jgi:serine/threonine-protein kinase RsbT